MYSLFKPAAIVMNRLPYARKVTLVISIIVLAVSLLSGALYSQLSKTVAIAERELLGVEKVLIVTRLIQLSQEYRGLSAVDLGKNKSLVSEQAYLEKLQQTEAIFYQVIEGLDPKLPLDSDFTERLIKLWEKVKGNHGKGAGAADQDFKEHTYLIKQLQYLVTVMGDYYYLITDSHLNSYYLISTLLNRLPASIEDLGQIRALTSATLGSGALSEQQKIKLIQLSAYFENDFQELQLEISKIHDYSPEIAHEISQAYAKIEVIRNESLGLIKVGLSGQEFNESSIEIYLRMTKNIDFIYDFLYQQIAVSLKQIIRQHANNAIQVMWLVMGCVSILVLLVFYLLLGSYYSVIASVKSISRGVTAFSTGDLNAFIEIEAKDEMRGIAMQINCMARSITELMNENEQEKERFKTLFEKSGNGLVLIENGIFIDCNEQSVNMMGYSSKEELMRSPAELSPEYQPDGRLSSEKAPEMMATCIETGVNHFDWVHKKQDGTEFWVEVLLTRLNYNQKQVIHVSWADISARKQLEIDTENAKNAAIAANKSKSEFLANMSHELRTPMHGILSFASFGIKKFDSVSPEKLQQYFSNIQVSGERLLALLNDLLDLSKFEAGKMDMHKRAANLYTVYEHSYLEQEQRMKDLALSIEVTQAEQTPEGLFDPVRIGQVITNILSNAVKFSPEGSVIKVAIEKTPEGKLQFILKDQGIGIPESELESVFDAFIQSSKTDSGSGGTGLGLAICNKIISAHNGEIWAENNPEGGAQFTFTIDAD